MLSAKGLQVDLWRRLHVCVGFELGSRRVQHRPMIVVVEKGVVPILLILLNSSSDRIPRHNWARSGLLMMQYLYGRVHTLAFGTYSWLKGLLLRIVLNEDLRLHNIGLINELSFHFLFAISRVHLIVIRHWPAPFPIHADEGGSIYRFLGGSRWVVWGAGWVRYGHGCGIPELILLLHSDYLL